MNWMTKRLPGAAEPQTLEDLIDEAQRFGKVDHISQHDLGSWTVKLLVNTDNPGVTAEVRSSYGVNQSLHDALREVIRKVKG